ncbi:formyltransferase family protein [Helicobacter sp. UBA3407]|uniref:formyltransferase family protein n=1 Tax=Helicobacter TaxID=209 RepID=UPI00260EB80B|nr:formyltransferase family protein [Helicobacter sp. UBA3407]
MNIAFFCTGEGSFFKFIWNNKHLLKVDKILLLSDRDCGVMTFLQDKKLSKTIYAKKCGDREFESQAKEWFLSEKIDYVFLSCNKILRYDLLECYGDNRKRMFNFHPSLLPKYIGLNSVQQAFDNKDMLYGASIHYAIKEVDCGGILARCMIERVEDDFELYRHRLFVNQAVLGLDFIYKLSLGKTFHTLKGVVQKTGFEPQLTIPIESIKFFNAMDSKLLQIF